MIGEKSKVDRQRGKHSPFALRAALPLASGQPRRAGFSWSGGSTTWPRV